MSEPVAAALALLPAWVPWAPALLIPLSAALAYALLLPVPWLLGGAIPQGVAWPERARLGFARRRGATVGGVSLAFCFGLVASLFAGPLSALSGLGLATLCALAAWLAALPMMARVTSLATGRPYTVRSHLRGSSAMLLIRIGHLLLLLGLAVAAPSSVGGWHVASLLVYVLATLAWYDGFGLRLARALGWAEGADARVRGLAEAAAGRAGIRLGGAYTLEIDAANALALPNSGEVLVTSAAARILSDAQLEAVLDHEVGHLIEPPGARRRRTAVGLAFAPLLLSRLLFESFGGFGILALLVYVMAVLWGSQRLSLRLERAADAHAHEGDPAVYAGALDALYRYNGVPPVLSRRATHPDLYDRLVAAGVPPDYPRPEPPSDRRSRLVIFPLMLLVAFGGTFGLVGLKRASFPAEGPAFLVGAVYGGDEVFLLDYADTIEDVEDRVALTRAAVEVSGGHGWVRLELVEVLLETQRCAEAEGTWAALLDDGWTPAPWDAEYAAELEGRVAACVPGAAKPRPGR